MSYSNFIESVALSDLQVSPTRDPFYGLKITWLDIEETCRANGYDIFKDVSVITDIRILRRQLLATTTLEQTHERRPEIEAAMVRHQLTVLKQKDREYGGSWLRRGGVGAFMMLARKWDRLENAVGQEQLLLPVLRNADLEARLSIMDDINDLRNYLILVEAHLQAEGKLG